MAPSRINILITTFAGTDLPPTLSLALPPTTPISSLCDELYTRLPTAATTACPGLLLTTLSSRFVPVDSTDPISRLLPDTSPSLASPGDDENDFLSLRLTPLLRGGKGGFGSQLRAAGGRMSKRNRKNAPAEEEHGSSRNLDGRRLRTVTEAKALAEYLAIKPEMNRKEKERRRQRWEQIVEMTERRQDEIKYGSKKVGLDGKWVEDKEETGERTREAVLEAMRKGGYSDNLVGLDQGGSSTASGSGSGSGSSGGEEEEDVDEVMAGREESGGSKATTPPSEPELAVEVKGKGKEKEGGNGKGPVKRFAGFDEDDEFMSSDDESGGEGAKA
ncbi:Telomere maintenance protein SDE2 [Madurella mycetomatis]|uniref:Telomere maintenance protein SDE2 n=1 Tax=Madurella mycetomatis TaxID=100816 RepID=A0A175W1S1_9PEZI|nr:Telomere maintenance protein SDE2 [Madurella mycetomatis]